MTEAAIPYGIAIAVIIFGAACYLAGRTHEMKIQFRKNKSPFDRFKI